MNSSIDCLCLKQWIVFERHREKGMSCLRALWNTWAMAVRWHWMPEWCSNRETIELAINNLHNANPLDMRHMKDGSHAEAQSTKAQVGRSQAQIGRSQAQVLLYDESNIYSNDFWKNKFLAHFLSRILVIVFSCITQLTKTMTQNIVSEHK